MASSDAAEPIKVAANDVNAENAHPKTEVTQETAKVDIAKKNGGDDKAAALFAHSSGEPGMGLLGRIVLLGGVLLGTSGGSRGGTSLVDNTPPAPPTLNVDDSDADGRINASGKSEPGSTVTITWPDGTTTATADGNGDWNAESPTAQQSGEVKAVATDINGNTGDSTSLPK